MQINVFNIYGLRPALYDVISLRSPFYHFSAVYRLNFTYYCRKINNHGRKPYDDNVHSDRIAVTALLKSGDFIYVNLVYGAVRCNWLDV